MQIIKSVKPSGTYVKVRLLQRWRGHEVGEDIVCNDKLADLLATKFIGAVLFEAPARTLQVAVH